jgi:hypothetical protein
MRNTEQKEHGPIMKQLSIAFLFAICTSLLPSATNAQEMVHAVSGTVTTIHPKIQMTDIDTDDGSAGIFQWTKPGVALNFDKNVSANTIAVDKFTALQAPVIAYYYGVGQVRTIVAVHELGTGPFVKSSGRVVKLDKHEHVLTIKNATGGEETFQIDAKTVADTETGVVTNFKFDYSKGVQVRVIAAQANGSSTALLIVPVI